jgi:hypothetical protein
MKITRQEHLAQVTRINAILDLVENSIVKEDLDNRHLEYVNNLESRLTVLSRYTMDECQALEAKVQEILAQFTKA